MWRLLGLQMRGKLKVPVGVAHFLSKGRGLAVEFGLTCAGNGTVGARIRAPAAWIAGILAVLVASSALPQGNIDAGKSPAQMFADTCSNCHRRPSELRRGASAGFLRQHYTPGAQEAAAMASYLAGIPADPRAGKEREKAKAPQEKAKTQPPQQQHAQERPPVQERPKAQLPIAKGKRPELAKSPPAEPHVEAPQETRVEAPPAPKLEPFEE